MDPISEIASAERESGSVLIVEDEPDIRDCLRLMLELEGYRVLTASNGREGLDVLLNGSVAPRIILLDLMMPVMNGWEFIQAVRQDAALASIPIILVTAYGEKAAEADVQQAIRKPIDLDLLLQSIRKYSA